MKIKIFVIVILLAFSSLYSQSSFLSYNDLSQYARTSPGAMKFGLYGFDNPALLNYVNDFDALFLWSSANDKISNFDNSAIFIGMKNFGLGVVQQKIGAALIADYRVASSFGNRNLSIGVAYGWSTGDKHLISRSNVFTLGALYRPSNIFSIGVVGTSTSKFDEHESIIELAVRPFGNEKLAIFSDYLFNENYEEAPWSVGVAVEALPGVRLTTRYFNTQSLNFGVELSLGNFGFTTQSNFDNNQKLLNNTYGIRLGAYDRNILSKLVTEKNHVKIDLKGEIKYQRFQLFDDSKTLITLLQQLDAIKNDPDIEGIEINTSGIATSRVMLWEIRTKLQELKDNGKKIVIYIDNANIDLYHFASVATKIIMDPLGMLTLEGFIMGKTFYKNTLEKIGIGFDEWRFFEYKSALETFSRETMSDRDRQQRQGLIDDSYELVKSEITSSRNISAEKFEDIVNNEVVLLAADALKKGLVDSLGRWYDKNLDLDNSILRKRNYVSMNDLEKFKLPTDNYWGEKPAIAIVYALGVCAMDEGISARTLVNDIEAAAKNQNVKAIILRVDSPGGDALASDVIAEALKQVKGKKPIIVSQGSVAASGGYWLSMYGDTIIAAPNTVTGSIGVIGGWYYNKNLKEDLGFTTDYVKRGNHADLGFGMTLPLLNITIPDRNLTEEERSKMENLLRKMYDGFLDKVSLGRGKAKEDVAKIAEGKVWSGTDALQIGLIDKIGGLETAINIAKEKIGIKDDNFQILQYPKMPLINFGSIIPMPFSIMSESNSELDQLKFRFKKNGDPLLMTPLDLLSEDFLNVEAR